MVVAAVFELSSLLDDSLELEAEVLEDALLVEVEVSAKTPPLEEDLVLEDLVLEAEEVLDELLLEALLLETTALPPQSPDVLMLCQVPLMSPYVYSAPQPASSMVTDLTSIW